MECKSFAYSSKSFDFKTVLQHDNEERCRKLLYHGHTLKVMPWMKRMYIHRLLYSHLDLLALHPYASYSCTCTCFVDRKMYRKAAVLVPLCSIAGEPSLLFTVRSMRLKAHSGQVRYNAYF